jgi:hypothetical protein
LNDLVFGDDVVFPGSDFTGLLAFGHPVAQFGYVSIGMPFLLSDGGTPRVSGTIVQLLNLDAHARSNWEVVCEGVRTRFRELLARFEGDEAWLPIEVFERSMWWFAEEAILNPVFWSNDEAKNFYASLWLSAGWQVQRVNARDGVAFFRRLDGLAAAEAGRR